MLALSSGLRRWEVGGSVCFDGIGRVGECATPLKTNMTLENPPFQWEIHFQMVEFPLSC